MGGGPSKKEIEALEKAKEERDKKREQNEKELESLKTSNANAIKEREKKLNERNRDLMNLKSKLTENTEKYENEVQEKLHEQAMAQEKLRNERAAELESVRNDGEEAKNRISKAYDQKAARLHEQHEAAMNEAFRKRDSDREKHLEDIRKAETERDELVKKQAKEEEQLKKDIEAKNRQHRKEIDDHFERLKQDIEESTRLAIDRSIEVANSRMAIADRQLAIVRSEAIRATLEGFYNEYKCARNEMKKLKETSDILSITMGKVEEDEYAIYEVKDLKSDLKSGTDVIDYYLDSLHHRMNMCLDVPDTVRRALEAPLQSYQNSCDDVKEVFAELEYACRKKDHQSIKSLKTKVDGHRLALKNTIDKMDKVDARSDLKAAVENIIQKSITA